MFLKYFIFNIFIILSRNLCFSLLSRKIQFEVNPGCVEQCDKPWIIHGQGSNVNNTMHYLWGGMKLPTFVLAVTDLETEITIDWKQLVDNTADAISFTSAPFNTFAIQFQSLILFNDVGDTGMLTNETKEENMLVYPLSSFDWELVGGASVNASSQVALKAVAYDGSPLDNRTELAIKVFAFPDEGRSKFTPHLITSPDAIEVELVLDRLNYSLLLQNFTKPRWAIDTIFVSDGGSEDARSFIYTDKKSLDDEHTPGVFDLMSITTPPLDSAATGQPAIHGGYLQWRPVAYLTKDRNVARFTIPNLNESLPAVDAAHARAADASLLNVLFGSNLLNRLNAQTKVSFGFSGDGFYSKYNYTVWTFAVGLGAPPEESFSRFAILLISIGLGLPFVLFVFGGIYLLCRRRGSDQLLLNENC